MECAADEVCWEDGTCRPVFARSMLRVGAYIHDFEVGSDRQYYVLGSLREPYDFGNGVVEPSGNSRGDMFIARFDEMGEFAWVEIVSSTQTISGNAITVDGDDNLYITGYLEGVASFPSRDLGSVYDSRRDVFIASYDADGTYRWGHSRTSESSNDDVGGALVAGADRLYVAGVGGRNLDLGGGSVGDRSGGKYMFVAAFTMENGDHIWSKGHRYFEDWNNPGVLTVSDIAVDSNEDLYITGRWAGFMEFRAERQPSSIYESGGHAYRSTTGFLVSYDGDTGIYRWLQTQDGERGDATNSVATDDLDNVYITGWTSTLPELDPELDPELATGDEAHTNQLFVASYESNGNSRFYSIATTADEDSDSFGNSIAVDPAGFVYVAGNISGTVEFAGRAFESRPSNYIADLPKNDFTLLQLDPTTGDLRWARSYGGPDTDTAIRVRARFQHPILAARPVGVVEIDGEAHEPMAHTNDTLLRFSVGQSEPP